MARLPLVQDDDATEDVRAAFEAANSFNGRVANSMRMFAHSPAIVRFLLPLQAVLACLVPVSPARPHGALGAVVRVRHPRRVEEVPLDVLRVGLTRHLLDDQAEEEVGRVVVDLGGAGLEPAASCL